MNSISFEALLDKYLSGSISEEERVLLSRMLEKEQYRQRLEAIMDKELQEHSFEVEEDSKLLGEIQENIQQRIREEKKAAKVVWFNRSRLAVAAVFILLVGLGAYLFWNSDKEQGKAVAIQQQPAVLKDIVPGSNKAILRLADGTEILLDSAQDGTLAQQGEVKVIKLNNGQLAYNTQKGRASAILYNTITTPKGGAIPAGFGRWYQGLVECGLQPAFSCFIYR